MSDPYDFKPQFDKISDIWPHPPVRATGVSPMVKGAVTSTGMTVEGYETLSRILTAAYDDSARGKGVERHANGLPWHEQQIIELQKMFGPGGAGFQLSKKAAEAFGMFQRGQHDAAIRELNGTICYAAAMILAIEMERDRK